MDMALQLRNLVVVEAHAEAKFVELYRTVGESPAHTLRNAVMEIFVGESASVEYVKIQEESDRNSHIERTEISQAANSRVSTHCFTFSGEIVRNELIFHLNGSHIETYLRGAYLLNEKQITDNYTEVHHKQPHCYSNELYKGVLNDRSRGVFNGLIHVYRDAQKTNAFQSNRNLLLSDSATMKTKPQLEIYADDVKCSHGAATGQIDADALFYMKARGIHEAAAKQLLVQAFAGEVADTVASDALREYVQHRIATKY
jgi:Fe-S cluster assembly protein SufD